MFGVEAFADQIVLGVLAFEVFVVLFGPFGPVFGLQPRRSKDVNILAFLLIVPEK